MKISLFKNVSETRDPQIYDLIDYLEKTRDGEWQDIVNKCRNIKDDSERNLFKKTMPTACLSGSFSYRNDSSLLNHSEIIAMDLDHVEDMQSLKGKLKRDKYVFSVFMSTSGYGLRVLFRIDPKKHNEAFRSISQYIFEKYGQPCDQNSHLSKPYIVSFDPDLYLSPDYLQVPVFDKYIKETIVKNVPSYIHNEDDFQRVFKEVVGRRINICESYNDWLKIGFGISEEYGEDGRYYFHEISRLSDKYKFSVADKQYTQCLKARGTGERINIKSFYYLAKLNGVNISSEKTKEIVRITKSSKKAGLSKKQISDNLKSKSGIEGVDNLIDKIYDSSEKDSFEDAEESMIYTLELFISNNYNLRLNEINGFFYNDGKQVTESDLNTIYIAAKKILPKLDFPLLKRLLKSDFIPHYNPILDFFGSDGIPVILPPIPKNEENENHKSPLIDMIADCIKNDEPAYTRFFVKKWLISIISSAHKVHSPLLLCLLGAQHTGKTEFFRRLMPGDLSNYYAESKLDKDKDDEILMTENLIIMDDELGGKSKKDAEKLKNITSKQYFSLRRPYGEHNEKILRLAVLCGTSNYKQIMSDPSGNRRVIPIEVKDIDKEKYNSINKKDLFVEMYRVYKSGFDWRVGPDDLKLLNRNEEEYSVTIKERELIIRYFEPGESEYLSTTDILVEIERLTNQKLSVAVLGRELGFLGFVKKSVRTGTYKHLVRSLWGVNKIPGDLLGQQKQIGDLPF